MGWSTFYSLKERKKPGVMESRTDKWSRWLLEGRFAGDPQQNQAVLTSLYPIRDKVLDHTNLGEGEVLLDVGESFVRRFGFFLESDPSFSQKNGLIQALLPNQEIDISK